MSICEVSDLGGEVIGPSGWRDQAVARARWHPPYRWSSSQPQPLDARWVLFLGCDFCGRRPLSGVGAAPRAF
jgi:hypothetical protein